MLSDSQLATLAELGDEHTADVGDLLYRVGDQRYPFIAIIEGEVAIVDAAGQEIIRHGPSRFLGELNLLSGQTVFVTAVVTQPLRYIAVDRDVMREVLFDDGPLSDLVLSTLIARREALQTVEGLGLQIVGPRSSDATMRMLDFARSNRLPFTWHDELPAEGEAPLVRLPGGAELRAPSRGQVLRAIGIGRELAPREEVDLLVVGGGPAGLAQPYTARRRTRHARHRKHRARRAGRLLAQDRELPRLPRRHHGDRARQPRRHPGAQVRSAAGDALPASRSSRRRATRRAPRGGARDRRAGCTARHRRGVPAPAGRRPPRLRGPQHLLRGRASGGTAVRRLAGGRCGRRQLGRPSRRMAGARRRARDVVASPRGSARDDVGLPRARARALPVSRCAIAARSRRCTARTGISKPSPSRAASACRSPSCSSSSARGRAPTGWGDTVARDENGFILTGSGAHADHLLQTSVPGIFAAGDVRSGSTKRCATAVGEGAMAVQFVHEHLRASADARTPVI